MTWTVEGQYFEACNCEAACPCVFLSPPTEGECTALLGWHVEAGDFDGRDLGGLNVGLAVYSPGHMAEVQWHVALYLDDRADEDQAAALGAIFGGAAGGHPQRLASHIGEVLGAGPATIRFGSEGRRRSMTIEGVADTSIVGIEGQAGGAVTVSGHPLAVAPGFPIQVARSEHLTFDDHGFDWKVTQKNGFFSPFAYSA